MSTSMGRSTNSLMTTGDPGAPGFNVFSQLQWDLCVRRTAKSRSSRSTGEASNAHSSSCPSQGSLTAGSTRSTS